AVEHHLVARPDALRLHWKCRFEDAEQTPLDLPQPWIPFARDVQRIRMAAPRKTQRLLAMVIQDINHRDKWMIRHRLIDEVAIEFAQHFAGRNEAIALSEDFLRPHPLLDEDGQQAGGHAMTHRVSHVEADVAFIQTKEVVEVAADAATERVVD